MQKWVKAAKSYPLPHNFICYKYVRVLFIFFFLFEFPKRILENVTEKPETAGNSMFFGCAPI